jgi:hypothetical protein
MARHLAFTAGFVATCAVVVPLGWHPLDASIERDGKKVRPLQQEVVIDGVRVTLDVDHNLIHTGDEVTATLRAYSDTPKQIAIDLAVYRASDVWGSRVAGMPTRIDLEHYRLSATPEGSRSVTTRLKLAGAGWSKVNTFRICAMARGHKLGMFADDAENQTAAVGVLGWTSNDFKMSIKPEGKIVAGQPFIVDVDLRGGERKNGDALNVELGTSIDLGGGVGAGDDYKIEELDGNRFRVTPANADAKQVTLIANAFDYGEDISPVVAGAVEAKTFEIAPAPKTPGHKVAER